MHQQTFPFAFPDPLSQRPMPPAADPTPMAKKSKSSDPSPQPEPPPESEHDALIKCQERVRYLEAAAKADRTTQIVKSVCGTITVGFLCWGGASAVENLAGKTTFANFVFDLLSKPFSAASVMMVAALVATLWGMAERAHRLKKVASMETQIRRLETLVDPTRTSSSLTSTGQTNPKDKR